MKYLIALNFLLVLSFTAGHPSTSDDRVEDKDVDLQENYYDKEDSNLDDFLIIYPIDENEDDFKDEDTLVRTKRQANLAALDLASNHQGPVGKINPKLDFNVVGNNGRNYQYQGGLGAGGVVWRSPDSRHSLGVGGYGQQSGGRSDGFRYKSKPDFGAGIGYKFRF